MQHLEGGGTPVLYIGRTVLNPLTLNLLAPTTVGARINS